MAVIAKKKLSEKVVDEIRKRMESGELKIGDKLPNQNQLAQELGVSRTSLREAMNILNLLGVIEQKPGYGTAIRKKIPEINPEGLKPTLLSDSKTTWELLEARLIIETGAVGLTAKYITKTQARMLLDLVDEMQALLDAEKYQTYAQVDLKFHTLISELSRNRFLKEAYVSIKQHMQLFINEHIQLLPHVLQESQKHHRAICQAVADSDVTLAEAEMESHILFLQESFKNYQKNKVASPRKK